jgi:hypothetical protein
MNLTLLRRYKTKCDCSSEDSFDCASYVCLDVFGVYEGDGWCDDGTYNVKLNCDEYSNDGGDCSDEPPVNCYDAYLPAWPEWAGCRSLQLCSGGGGDGGYCKKCEGLWCGVENPGGLPTRCFNKRGEGWRLNVKLGRCVNGAVARCTLFEEDGAAAEAGCYD